jgi:hypothetical protein
VALSIQLTVQIGREDKVTAATTVAHLIMATLISDVTDILGRACGNIVRTRLETGFNPSLLRGREQSQGRIKTGRETEEENERKEEGSKK